MRTPSPTSRCSHSVAAATLLQLSQTPSQPAAISRGGTSTPRNLERQSTDAPSPASKSSRKGSEGVANMGTPRTIEGDVYIVSSPMSDSAGVVKVSNSDDEDMDEQSCMIHRDNTIDVPHAPHAVSRVETRLPQVSPAVLSTEGSEPTFAPRLAVMKRPNTAPFHSSSYPAVDNLHDIYSMSVAGSAYARPVGRSNQLAVQVPRTGHPALMTGPDKLEAYLRHSASFSQQGYEASLRHASIPFHMPSQPTQQTRSESLPTNGAMMGQRSLSQSTPQIQYLLPPAIDATVPKQAQQPFASAKEPHVTSSLYGKLVPNRTSSESAEGRRKVQIPRAPSQAQPKRVRVPAKSQAVAAPRHGFGPKPIDVRDFKYRTIKAINMPARNNATPGQQPPEPTPDSQPYGDNIDYRASMLIWWCDDLELAYSETVRRYRLKFPDERSITEDTVRKRHILFLEKLARRYGLKPEDELQEPSGKVAIRGKNIGHKYNTINGVHVYSAAAGHDVAGTVRRRRVGNEPTQHRGFLKACICVWRDTSSVSNEEIKQRLQNDYGWNIGANTVNKLYYSERARVYDTHNKRGMNNQETFINNADEDLEQLRAHLEQRKTYLLETFGQQVPAQDAAYMQQLEQLIDSMEQAQLQRTQHMDSGPTRMIEEAVEEVHDAGETDELNKDLMMQDADVDIAGDRGID